jgi:copper/silver-translocating P-type ATPase
MNVYTILEESGALRSGTDPRTTDLFLRSLELGLISNAGAAPSSVPSALDGPAEEMLFHVSGLWCSACAWLIEYTLRRQPGVLSAEVFFVSDLLKIRYQPQYFPTSRVPALLDRLGYQASHYSGETDHAESERKDLLTRLGVAAFLWVNVMALNLSVYLGAFDRMPGDIHRILPFIVMALASPVLLYSARPILRIAYRGLLARTLRMESLLALGILSAFTYSTVESIRGGNHIYFDISCAITTLVLIGKSIEQSAKHRAARTIASLHRMLPIKARVLESGREHFVSLQSLRPGSVFVVKAGERIPADGIVLEGESEADESLLTGESAPVAKHSGTSVAAGSLNLSSVLTICATTVGEDSTIARIVAAVERAVSSRSDLERKADRVARAFVPAVIAVAVITAAALLASGLTPETAILRAVTILVIACPCALGIATPLTITAAVGAASRAGILVRDSRVLEFVSNVDTVLLDKTGTITEEDLTLADIPLDDLALIASLETYSEHPLGKAAVRRARELHLSLLPASNVRVHRGSGIEGDVDGHHVTLAAGRYSIDGARNGALTFATRVRADAKALVDGLRKRGIDVLLVSGDSESATQATASAIGITRAFASTPPDRKATLVQSIKSEGRTVAMIGDGINDAPALAAADLGIAMGSGADLARHAASMVLLSGNLTRVLTAFDLSRRTVSIVRQNLFWAFFYNTAGIAFAAAGLLSPILAAGAMVVSSLSVIANSYRLAR